MKIFLNYLKEECLLSDEQEVHIRSRHPDATDELIGQCLKDPLEVRKSTSNKIAKLYYSFKCSKYYFCVVVKSLDHKNFVSTAYTTNKIKNGEIVYQMVRLCIKRIVKMYIYYDKDLDYVEIFFKKQENYLCPSDENEEVGEFLSAKDDSVIGYAIENLDKNFDSLDFLTPYQKLSIVIKKYRLQYGKTQQEVADEMGIKLLPYQRLESGENNPTLKTLLKVKKLFPEIDLDKIAS